MTNDQNAAGPDQLPDEADTVEYLSAPGGPPQDHPPATRPPQPPPAGRPAPPSAQKPGGRRSVRVSGDRETELVYRFRWSMTQIAVLAIGVFLMALGGITIARAGAEGFDSLINPEVVVGAWHRTPLMGILEISLGLLFIVAGSQKLSPNGLYRIFGAMALVFGIVVAAQPSTFDAILGASRNTGWVYSFLGVILLALGFGSPIVFEREVVSGAPQDDPSVDLTR